MLTASYHALEGPAPTVTAHEMSFLGRFGEPQLFGLVTFCLLARLGLLVVHASGTIWLSNEV